MFPTIEWNGGDCGKLWAMCLKDSFTRERLFSQVDYHMCWWGVFWFYFVGGSCSG